MASKSAISKIRKSLNSKTKENRELKKENLTLTQDLNAVKRKLEHKLRSVTSSVSDEVVRAKNTLGSVLEDITGSVDDIKNKSLKVISGGAKKSKTYKKKRTSRKNKSVSWWS